MKKLILILSILFILLAAGCGSQEDSLNSERETQEFINAVETGIIETIDSALFETAAAATKEASSSIQTEVPVNASVTPEAMPTQTATQQPVMVTPTSTLLPTPCYRAELIDETIPDGTVIEIGQGFTKTWVVKNTGVCAWSENFRWKLVEGEDFRAATDLKISAQDVMPGDTISISIEMNPPLIPGHYRSIYKIFTEDGAEVTPNGFWIDVEIVPK